MGLSELAKFINGNAYKPTDWEEKGLPIIRIQNLNGSTEFNYTTKPLGNCVLVNQGDLLFGWSGNRGTSFGPYIWKGPQGVLNQHIFKVVENKDIDKNYLFMALKVMTPQFESVAHGSAGLVHIKKSVLLRFNIPKPTKKEQQATGAAGLEMEATLATLEKNTFNLMNLRGNFLNEIFRI